MFQTRICKLQFTFSTHPSPAFILGLRVCLKILVLYLFTLITFSTLHAAHTPNQSSTENLTDHNRTLDPRSPTHFLPDRSLHQLPSPFFRVLSVHLNAFSIPSESILHQVKHLYEWHLQIGYGKFETETKGYRTGQIIRDSCKEQLNTKEMEIERENCKGSSNWKKKLQEQSSKA